MFIFFSASSTVWSSPLPVPANITNADVIVECNYALYSCREGYYSNGASSYIVYDGQTWSSTAMECRRKCNCLFKVILTNYWSVYHSVKIVTCLPFFNTIHYYKFKKIVGNQFCNHQRLFLLLALNTLWGVEGIAKIVFAWWLGLCKDA